MVIAVRAVVKAMLLICMIAADFRAARSRKIKGCMRCYPSYVGLLFMMIHKSKLSAFSTSFQKDSFVNFSLCSIASPSQSHTESK